MKPPSPLRAAIVAAGFEHNEYLLDINGCLMDPAPRYPASRMFKWPISVDRFEDRLTVCHPAMATEPFVALVMSTLRVAVEIEPNPRGGCNGSWCHGGDLADDKNFRDLIKTRALVDDRVIMRGVTHGVMGKRLSPANARIVLAAIEVEEPADRSSAALSAAGGMIRPSFIDDGLEKGKKIGKGRWAVNLHSNKNPRAEPWAAIHGVERGFFRKDKYGFHNMSTTGMIHYTGGPPAP